MKTVAEEAERLREAFRQNPTDSQAGYDLCVFLQYTANDIAGSAAVAEEYYRTNPQSSWAAARLCELLTYVGRAEEAVEYAKRNIQIERANNANRCCGQWTYDRWADALRALGRSSEIPRVMEQYKREDAVDVASVITQAATMPEHELETHAYQWVIASRYQDALDLYAAFEAAGRKSTDDSHHSRRGTCHMNLGRPAEAAQAFRTSLGLCQHRPAAVIWNYEHLTKAYACAGDMQAEREAWYEYLGKAEKELFSHNLVLEAYKRLEVIEGAIGTAESVEVVRAMKQAVQKLFEADESLKKAIEELGEISVPSQQPDDGASDVAAGEEEDIEDAATAAADAKLLDSSKAILEGHAAQAVSQRDELVKESVSLLQNATSANDPKLKAHVARTAAAAEHTGSAARQAVNLYIVRNDRALYAYFGSFISTFQQCYLSGVMIKSGNFAVENKLAQVTEAVVGLVPFAGGMVGSLLRGALNELQMKKLQDRADNMTSIAPTASELESMLHEITLERIVAAADYLRTLQPKQAENLAEVKSAQELLNYILRTAKDFLQETFDNTALDSSKHKTPARKLGFAHASALIGDYIATSKIFVDEDGNDVDAQELCYADIVEQLRKCLAEVIEAQNPDFTAVVKSGDEIAELGRQSADQQAPVAPKDAKQSPEPTATTAPASNTPPQEKQEQQQQQQAEEQEQLTPVVSSGRGACCTIS